jgi:A/G-specific adenine glycosylase
LPWLLPKEFAALAFELPKDNPATLTRRLWSSCFAMRTKSPNGVCVFNDSCAALQKKKVDQLPVKSKKLQSLL